MISEFDVQIALQKSVKGCIITNMLAECPNEVLEDNPPDNRISSVEEYMWIMLFDGVVNLFGSGTCTVLISLDGQYWG